MSSNETTLREKLIAAQADMANPVKSKAVKSAARSYNYEVLSDVLEIVTDALHAHGLGLIQGVKPCVTDYQGTTTAGTIIGWWLQTGVTDGEEELTLDTRPLDFPADPQVAGSKETYARRYALKTAFGLAGVDDDGEAAHQMASRASQTPQNALKATTTTQTPTKELEDRMKALLRQCANAGLDVKAIGARVSAEIGKKSVQFQAPDYERAIAIIDETLKEAESIGNE